MCQKLVIRLLKRLKRHKIKCNFIEQSPTRPYLHVDKVYFDIPFLAIFPIISVQISPDLAPSRMNHSDTLELSLQLLRQPSVTPVDHDCQNIMADRLAKLVLISKSSDLRMSITYGLVVVQKIQFSVLLVILMWFQLDT